jgi:uncharacterized membrane protein YfcA
MTEIYVFSIILIAILVQTLIGFGGGLIAMPLLAQAIGLRTAAPAFAILILLVEVLILLRHRHAFRFGQVWRLIVASVIAIPFGITAGGALGEQILLPLLGVVIIGYALYALSGLHVPRLGKHWAFAFGMAAGFLSGAYSTGGPPYVIYGTSQRWSPVEFKVNIQSAFVVSSLFVISGHVIAGRVTPPVLTALAFGLPAALIALLVGFRLEAHISPSRMRRMVLLVLLILGLTLLF